MQGLGLVIGYSKQNPVRILSVTINLGETNL